MNILQMLIIFFTITPLFFPSIFSLNSDKTTLLSFKQSLISHQLSLQSWNQADPNPCSWTGVSCSPKNGRVTTLSLPNSNLIGSIPTDFHLQNLQILNLSNNSINGTIPISLFNSELEKIDLSSNFITGEIPAEITDLQSLRTINLSNNLFFGELPEKLGFLMNLSNISLSNNNFSGKIPNGFDSIQVFDISSNLFNSSLPIDFNGGKLNYLNISNNKLSGYLYHEFAQNIPANAVIDLSYNNFTGQIPQTPSFLNQKTNYFDGNLNLCGKPLTKVCTVPSTLSTSPNVTSDVSESAAIAAMPENSRKSKNHGGRNAGCGKIVAIVVGDLVVIVVLGVVFVFLYRYRNKKMKEMSKKSGNVEPEDESSWRSQLCMNRLSTTCSCFKCETGEDTSETTEFESHNNNNTNNNIIIANSDEKSKHLVMVDGETELEIETLLKASAYILGSSNGSIVYKAVIEGNVAFAVRRIADCKVAKMSDFEKIVRNIGKFRHRNLVKISGFYWEEEEKLVIYEYVSNGSLAGAVYKKVGSSSLCHLSFEARVKIAKGIAAGLSYIHEKKHVHGNIKTTNILLTSDMEPLISDFGLEWLISGKPNYISHGCISPYHAPESMKTLKPNPKWDVYSFGIILLELLSGKVLSGEELTQWNIDSSISENETKILKIVNEFSTNMHDRKDSIVSCFKLGFNCASLNPRNRPSMKEALQVLGKITCSS